jgi:hypothetical protein
MTVTVLDRALAAGDAGRVTGERQERPDPEVPRKGDLSAYHDSQCRDGRPLSGRSVQMTERGSGV